MSNRLLQRLFRKNLQFLNALEISPDTPKRYGSSLVCLHRKKIIPSITNCIPKYRASSGQLATFCSSNSDRVAHPREDFLRLHPNDFAVFLKDKGISRCYFLWDTTTGEIIASHPELQEFSDWFSKDISSGYRQHEAIFMQLGLRTGCLMAVFLSGTNRGQAYGSTRMRDYKTMEIFLREGLKWSQMIGYKAALAGLWVSINSHKGPQIPNFAAQKRERGVWRDGILHEGWKVPYNSHNYSKSLKICIVEKLRLACDKVDVEKHIQPSLSRLRLGTRSEKPHYSIGGGNSIISEPFDKKHCHPDFREKMFFDYGDFLTGLNGCFIAGEGMGLHLHDINNIHSRTRFVNCVSDDMGGSGNPAIVTGKGVIMAMEAALDHLNLGPIEGKRIAVQGAGSIGYVIISELLSRHAEEIIVTDCNQKRLDDVYDTLSSKGAGKLILEKVQPDDESILEYDCDILAPCASSYIFSQRNIPKVSAKVICGATNNQLTTPVADCKLLEHQGSTYVVDFVANRMAIVNSANEGYGRLPFDPAVSRHLNETDEGSIFQHTKYILEHSENEKTSAVEAAYKLAEERTKELHPIWPHRCQQIIQSLVKRNWHLGTDFWRKRRNFTGFGGDA
ncbi:Leucine dehydrogenase [Nymphon striatum]|nr:Leucine dehydrogenase [Nymphon striatum]